MNEGIAAQLDTPTAPPVITSKILDEAAEWLMLLNTGSLSDEDRKRLEQWRTTSREHACAWDRAEHLLAQMGSLPAHLAMPALDRPARAGRRVALMKLAALLAVVPAGWTAWHVAREQPWRGQYRTMTGERRELILEDGTRVTLNTGTAMDVNYADRERSIILHRGDIYVQTAPDPSGLKRPLFVYTPEGRAQAIGTRYTVERRHDESTAVAVIEGAVRIAPRDATQAQARTLQAGEQAVYSARHITAVSPLDAASTAWINGMLLADNLRLTDVVAALGRYRRGVLRCDADAADIRVSGSFPTMDTDRALGMLAATHPIAVTARLGGLWTTVARR